MSLSIGTMDFAKQIVNKYDCMEASYSLVGSSDSFHRLQLKIMTAMCSYFILIRIISNRYLSTRKWDVNRDHVVVSRNS